MSGYDWEGAANRQGERVPDGVHRLKIDRVVRGGKKGLFKSKDGDAQIMVVFTGRDDAEVSQLITLSAKAGWVLARLLHMCGESMTKLKADGVEPQHFAVQSVADQYLVGAECWCRVETELRDGKSWPRVTPITAEEAGQATDPPTKADGSVGADPFADAVTADKPPF